MRLKNCLTGLLAAPLAVLLLTCSTPLYAATKIMPLGDSITGSPGCWRAYLWEKLLLSNYNNIDMVGTLPAQGCAVAHDGDNEGHGGILATNMANQSQLPPWLAATKPDVVLMHLGTNDVWSSRPTTEILAAFTTLVQQMRASNANMKIVVAKIIPMDSARSCSNCANSVIALNNALPAWANNLSTSASPITVADIWTNFSAINDTSDGVHPTDTGHKKMADAWYPVVVSALGGTTSSSKSSSSISSSKPSSASSTSKSSVVASSSSKAASSSSSVPSGQQCNWYGTRYPLCANTTSGWGYENNKSCIAPSTCSAQPAPYGIVGSSSSSSSKSSSSSTSNSIRSSSSSSSIVSMSKCQHIISNDWNTGFTGAIRITNNGTTAINGWTVTWAYSDGTKLTNSWNGTLTGTNPYSATNLSWNNTIQPGQSVEVGIQGNKGSSTTVQIPVVSGSVCN